MEASFEKSNCRFIIYGMENPHIGIQIIAVMFSMRENVDHKKGKLQLKCTMSGFLALAQIPAVIVNSGLILYANTN